jgi:hypothetical protein
MRKEYKVYVLRDIQTEKIVYAGLTRMTLQRRFQSHKVRFKNKPKFNIELVTENLSIEEAVELEKMLIKQYDLLNTGYNKSPGSINGSSNYHSEDQKKKWSEERKGKPVNPEHAAKNKVARLGHKNPPDREYFQKAVMCLNDGKVFKSARDAAKYYNIQYSKISLVCNGKRLATKGLRFVFVETVEPSRNA